MQAVQIDVTQIPSSDVSNLCHTFLSAVKKFYEAPGNMDRFEEWKRCRDNKAVIENNQK